MSGNLLLDAMNNICDEYLVSAMKMLSNNHVTVTQTQIASRFRLRRSLSLTAAVILIITVCFITVLAADSVLRTDLFRFLGIESPEIITEPSDMVAQSDIMSSIGDPVMIGDVIRATYIQFPLLSHGNSGVFLVCDDPIQMNSGNRYSAYYESDGSFIPLESQLFERDYHILGNEIHLSFEWVTYQDTVVITYAESEDQFIKPKMSGNATSSLFSLTVNLPNGLGHTNYPVLINLESGELTDICAGTGVEQIPGICQSAISEDLQKMLLADDQHNLYYVDLVAKTTYSLDQISGRHVDECTLIGNSLVCWALEDASIEDANLGTYSAWLIDLNSFERTELFSEIPATALTSYDVWSETYYIAQENPDAWASIRGEDLPEFCVAGLQYIDGFSATWHAGAMFTGSSFAVITDDNRNVYVMNLVSGEKSLVEGFLWPEGDPGKVECIPSADGNKLLVVTRGEKTYYDSIGVLDFAEKTLYMFSRENVSGINERAIYWFDNDSVLVETSDISDWKNYYLYRIN